MHRFLPTPPDSIGTLSFEIGSSRKGALPWRMNYASIDQSVVEKRRHVAAPRTCWTDDQSISPANAWLQPIQVPRQTKEKAHEKATLSYEAFGEELGKRIGQLGRVRRYFRLLPTAAKKATVAPTAAHRRPSIFCLSSFAIR